MDSEPPLNAGLMQKGERLPSGIKDQQGSGHCPSMMIQAGPRTWEAWLPSSHLCCQHCPQVPQALDSQLSPALWVTRPSSDPYKTLPGFEVPPSCSSNLTMAPDLLSASLFWCLRDSFQGIRTPGSTPHGEVIGRASCPGFLPPHAYPGHPYLRTTAETLGTLRGGHVPPWITLKM